MDCNLKMLVVLKGRKTEYPARTPIRARERKSSHEAQSWNQTARATLARQALCQLSAISVPELCSRARMAR